MKDKPLKQPPATAAPSIFPPSVVAEALAIHKARQKPKSPPNEMPVTPKLPRARKPGRGPRKRGR